MTKKEEMIVLKPPIDVNSRCGFRLGLRVLLRLVRKMKEWKWNDPLEVAVRRVPSIEVRKGRNRMIELVVRPNAKRANPEAAITPVALVQILHWRRKSSRMLTLHTTDVTPHHQGRRNHHHHEHLEMAVIGLEIVALGRDIIIIIDEMIAMAKNTTADEMIAIARNLTSIEIIALIGDKNELSVIVKSPELLRPTCISPCHHDILPPKARRIHRIRSLMAARR